MKPDALHDFFTRDKTANLPRLSSSDTLTKMLNVATRDLVVNPEGIELRDYYWDERRFNLKESSLFNSLSDDIKKKILRDLSLHSLVTSYYIEKLAISFCSRMIILSESIEEKALYTVIGAEEVYHWLDFKRFLPKAPEEQNFQSIFINTLADSINSSNRLTSIYIGQVLLEGFGIYFYSSMKEGCLDENLKKVFARILEDEGRHHGSALHIFDQAKREDIDLEEIVTKAESMIRVMLRHGSHIVKVIEMHAGKINPEAVERFYLETDMRRQMENRSVRLKQMIERNDKFGLLDELLKRDVFSIEL